MLGEPNGGGRDESIWKREPNIHELRRVLANFDNDPQSAIPGLESLAERGSMVSMEYLGEAYGRRLPALDWDAAKYWYARADELGSARGAFALAVIVGKRGDSKGAFDAYRRSCDRGYLPATYRLGRAYAKGEGAPKDLNRARELWEQAAQRGHIFAKSDLTRLYLSGAFGFAGRLRGLAWYGSLIKDFIVSGIPELLLGRSILGEERTM